MKLSFIMVVVCLVSGALRAQHLQRRPFLGIQVMNLSDSLRNAIGVPANTGAQVAEIIPNGTADKMGVKPGDIILSINEEQVKDRDHVVAMARSLSINQNLVLGLLRNGKRARISGKVLPMPFETISNGEVLYDEVALLNGGYARAIVKKPKGRSSLPAVFFMQGFGCNSIDNLPETDPQRRLMDGLVAKGYAVFRMEKPGTGDTYGTKPCMEIGYKEEADAFLAGLKKLKSYDFVDQQNVFLFGHSLGGNTAPLIASQEKVKGILVYGVTGLPWFEYMIRVFREQRPLFGIDYVQVDQDMQELIPLVYEYMVEKKTPEVLAANEKYRPHLQQAFAYDGRGHIMGRHYTFLQELQELYAPKVWKTAGAYTLAVYGEADVQALSVDGARLISDVVNSYYPGKGSYMILPKTDHGFIEVGTKKDVLRLNSSNEYGNFARTHFSMQLVEMADAWMKDVMRKH